jgi:hypothetical protein
MAFDFILILSSKISFTFAQNPGRITFRNPAGYTAPNAVRTAKNKLDVEVVKLSYGIYEEGLKPQDM